MMRYLSFLLVGFCLVTTTVQAQTPVSLPGFNPSNASEQIALEKVFDSRVTPDNLRSWMETMSAKPHHVGSPHNRANAEFIANRFREWGFDTELEVFHVLFPTPKERLVELVAPHRFKALLDEPAIDGDKTSSVRTDLLPGYNAYSADGDVTAELVYVNQGIPADYDELKKMGIDVRGKIVIARYGGSWRGIKPKVAAEHGAIGCILYSDPRDDGYFQGDVYPRGAWRMENGVQRGSVSDMPQYPGDPLTPGVGAKEDTQRLSVEDSPVIMKIPVLPISYADASPLLSALEGPVAPASWRGALPITYHVGPGPAVVRLNLAFNWDIVPAYNVIAKLTGSEYPDEWVIRGNHRDAWTFGAADPISGLVALMEEARIVGELAKEGKRPKRTLVYAAWDAEEPGLLGSTEWVEYHAEELDEKAVVYINSDGTGRGYLGMGGSHILETFINTVARDVSDPQTGISVQQRVRLARMKNGDPTVGPSGDLGISPLGSGSDYTPFLQHLGIPSLNLGFGGQGGGGSYHSTYDSFDHYTRFVDGDFSYGATLTKTAGRATLRMANAGTLPYRAGSLIEKVRTYLDEIVKMTDGKRSENNRLRKLHEVNAYAMTTDPAEPEVIPEKPEVIPFLSFAPVQNAIETLGVAATELDKSLAAIDTKEIASVAGLNALLMRLERSMTHPDGLPRRPWFRHQIYAPGFYTGYGVKTLPGIREAIEKDNWMETEQQITRLAGVLTELSAAMNKAAELARK